MIKIKDGEITVDGTSVQSIMVEASMLIMGTVRTVRELIGKEKVSEDELVQDLFKSLRFAALSSEGIEDEEIMKMLEDGTEKKLLID